MPWYGWVIASWLTIPILMFVGMIVMMLVMRSRMARGDMRGGMRRCMSACMGSPQAPGGEGAPPDTLRQRLADSELRRHADARSSEGS